MLEPPAEGGRLVYPVYAKKIPSAGYSLTNLMYGQDGYVYLAYDGAVYCRKCKLVDPKPIGKTQLKRILKTKLQPYAASGLTPTDDEVLSSLADYVIGVYFRIKQGRVEFTLDDPETKT